MTPHIVFGLYAMHFAALGLAFWSLFFAGW